MSGDDDLDAFLAKVDDVGSIISELNTSDGGERTDLAMKKADKFLKAYQAEEEEKKSHENFNRTIINKSNDPPQPPPHQQLNSSEMDKEAFMKYVEQDSKQRTIRRNENIKSSLVWKEKGNTSFKTGDYTDAVECYTKAISLAPDQVVYYSNRAQAYIKLGKYGLAIEDCETGMKLEAKNIKLHIHKGRGLMYMSKFQEATDVFNNILKMDKKHQNLVSEYLNELNKRKGEFAKETEVVALLQQGDKSLVEIKIIIDTLRKGLISDTVEVTKSLNNLKNLMQNSNHQMSFRQCKGFNMFCENQTLKNMIKEKDKDMLTFQTSIIALLSNLAEDNEENCCIVSAMENVLHLTVHIIENDGSLSGRFESIQFLYRCSQYTHSRTLLIKNMPIERLLDKVLLLLGSGGDLTLVALGMINNLALDKKFVNDFEEKLSADFIPGILKMMDFLCLPMQQDEHISKNFLPVMNTSITTIANLFHSPTIRKRFVDHPLWKTAIEFLNKYCNELHDVNKQKMVVSTFGMLMNLSIEPVVLKKEIHDLFIKVSSIVLSSKENDTLQERCCGLWSHLLKHNEDLLKKVSEQSLHLQFIHVLKTGNEVARKYVIKCLALLTSVDEKTCNSLCSRKAIPKLLDILSTSKDNIEIGNTSLCFSHISKHKNIAAMLVGSDLIKLLLSHATNDELPNNVRHNCAVAIGKFALLDGRYLQQLRDLHGMEILHEVMKENKMV